MKSTFCKMAVVAAGLVLTFCGDHSAMAKSAQIVYSSYHPENGPAIFVHDTKTETRYQISDPMDPDRSIDDFALDAKGKTLAYVSDRETTQVNELYTISMKKGTNAKVNTTLVTGADVQSIQFDAKGKNLFYGVKQISSFPSEIRRVDLKKNTVSLMTPADATTSVEILDYKPLPKGDGIICIADLETNGKYELFLSRGQDMPALKLSVPGLNPSGFVRYFQIDSKGKGVIYLYNADENSENELFYTDLKTGLVTKLNEDLPEGGSVGLSLFDPKGKTVVYIADSGNEGLRDLFKIDLKSKFVTKLNQGITDNFDVRNFSINSRGKYVAFITDSDTPDRMEIYRVGLKSGEIETVNKQDGETFYLGLLMDRKGNVYYMGEEVDTVAMNVFARDMKKGTITRIDDPDQIFGYVYTVQVDDKGTGAAYYAIDLGTFNSHYIYFDKKTNTRHSFQREEESVVQFKLINSNELSFFAN